MRENPDTSLKLLRLLADDPHYPSRLTEQEITSQIGVNHAGDRPELGLQRELFDGPSMREMGILFLFLALLAAGLRVAENKEAVGGS